MRVGVVCEGPTDWPAIVEFFGSSLRSIGIFPTFVSLFPEMDRSRPEGGWGNVLLWFKKYPAASRIQQFFGGGLFGGGLATDPLDALIIQLDADVLDDQGFVSHVRSAYGIEICSPEAPQGRAEQIKLVLASASAFDHMTNVDIGRHVLVASVEATESWCVSAFNARPSDREILRGQDLTNAFMRALEMSEGRPVLPNYTNIDKSITRRTRFCVTHKLNFDRILRDCPQFAAGFSALRAISN